MNCPTLLRQYLQGWIYVKAVTNLTYNYVLSGFQADNPIILKLGLDSEALKQEAFALRCFAGCGVVKVIAEDKGMLLLERGVINAYRFYGNFIFCIHKR